MSAPDYEALASAIWNEHWNVPVRDCDRYERALRHAARIETAALALISKLVEAQEEIVRVCTWAVLDKYGCELEELREALEADTE